MSDFPPPAPPTMPAPVGPPQLKTGLAITALVLGIVGVVACPPLGLAGIVTGWIAIARAGARPHEYGGKGMAIAGLTCGCCSIFTFLLMISILLPSLSRARELSKRLVCAANIKGIATTVKIYEHEHPGQGMPSLNYFVQQGDITPMQLVCPSSGLSNYVLVSPPADIPPARAVLIYEPASNHAGEGGNVAFADGSARFLKGSDYEGALESAAGQQP